MIFVFDEIFCVKFTTSTYFDCCIEFINTIASRNIYSRCSQTVGRNPNLSHDYIFSGSRFIFSKMCSRMFKLIYETEKKIIHIIADFKNIWNGAYNKKFGNLWSTSNRNPDGKKTKLFTHVSASFRKFPLRLSGDWSMRFEY